MKGIINFLSFVNENYVLILVAIGLLISIFKKVKNYFAKSDEEKIAIAKEQVRELILKMTSDAEKDYAEWNKAGSIKRSQVIGEIFATYPVLSRVIDQSDLIAWIDEQIDTALEILREVIEINKEANNVALNADK